MIDPCHPVRHLQNPHPPGTMLPNVPASVLKQNFTHMAKKSSQSASKTTRPVAPKHVARSMAAGLCWFTGRQPRKRQACFGKDTPAENGVSHICELADASPVPGCDNRSTYRLSPVGMERFSTDILESGRSDHVIDGNLIARVRPQSNQNFMTHGASPCKRLSRQS